MANIKSAKKRVLTSQVRADRNKAVKSRVKTYIKKVDAAVAANDKEAAQAALPVAIAEISKAASKGIFHKNTAARKVCYPSHNKGCKLFIIYKKALNVRHPLTFSAFILSCPQLNHSLDHYVLWNCMSKFLPAHHILEPSSCI